MVKFQDSREPDYNTVAEYLSRLAQEAPKGVDESWNREKGHRSARFAPFLIS
jgi:hypothetical protein